jgi:hypothetical protein
LLEFQTGPLSQSFPTKNDWQAIAAIMMKSPTTGMPQMKRNQPCLLNLHTYLFT